LGGGITQLDILEEAGAEAVLVVDKIMTEP